MCQIKLGFDVNQFTCQLEVFNYCKIGSAWTIKILEHRSINNREPIKKDGHTLSCFNFSL